MDGQLEGAGGQVVHQRHGPGRHGHRGVVRPPVDQRQDPIHQLVAAAPVLCRSEVASEWVGEGAFLEAGVDGFRVELGGVKGAMAEEVADDVDTNAAGEEGGGEGVAGGVGVPSTSAAVHQPLTR